MKMAFLICVGLILIFTGIIQMSPISTEVNELLFFMTDQDEKSFENNAVNNSVIEKVKARILHSLNLKEVPKTHAPAPPLQMSQNNSWSGRLTTSSTHDKSLFFHSDIVPNTCFDRKGAQCLRFQIKLETVRQNMTSSEIWLFKKEGVLQFKLSLLKEGNETLSRETFRISNQNSSAGWIRLDATNLLNKMSSNLLDLEVYSKWPAPIPIQTGKDKNPLLIVNFSEGMTRIKRSTGECEKGMSSCCVKNVYVSFKEIGWDSWIVQPEGYSANICKGSCENRMDLSVNHHTTVMILLMSKSKRNISDIKESIHCLPKTYKPLSIIYTDESGVKVISNLQKMSVSECSCT